MVKNEVVLFLSVICAIVMTAPTDDKEIHFARLAHPDPHHHPDCDYLGGSGGFGGLGVGASADAEASAGGFGGMAPFGGGSSGATAGAGAQASANAGSQAFGK